MKSDEPLYKKTTWPLACLAALWAIGIATIWLLPKGTAVSHGVLIGCVIGFGVSFLLGAFLLAIRIRAYYRWTKSEETISHSSATQSQAPQED